MRKIFVDTSYWIAVLNPTDSLHDFANNLTLTLFPSKLVTSELILNELLNHYSGSGSRFREITSPTRTQINQQLKIATLLAVDDYTNDPELTALDGEKFHEYEGNILISKYVPSQKATRKIFKVSNPARSVTGLQA